MTACGWGGDLRSASGRAPTSGSSHGALCLSISKVISGHELSIGCFCQLFWRQGLCRSGWLQMAEGDLELRNLPLPPGAGVNRIPPPCRFYAALGVKPRPLCHWTSTLLSWAAFLPSFDFIPFVDQETWMQIVVFFLPKLLSVDLHLQKCFGFCYFKTCDF